MTDRKNFNLYASRTKQYPESDQKGSYRKEEFQQRRNIGSLSRNTMVYPIKGIQPKEGYRWQVSPSKYNKLKKENRILIEKHKIFEKIYESDEDNFAYEPFWSFIDKDLGTSESGKLDLNEILGINHGLETVKPFALIEKLIYHSTNKDALILDSFAGSGTTAHATLSLNKEDGGNRKFILVECEDYADTITAQRVRRVIKGVPTATDKVLKNGLEGGFTYCTLGKAVEMDNLLSGNNLPSFESLGTLLFHTATNEVIDTSKIDEETGYLGTSSNYHVWLIYKPDLDFLKSNEAALTLDKAKNIAKSKRGKKRHLVFAPATFVSHKTLANGKNGKGIPVDHQPLPWSLYRVAGS